MEENIEVKDVQKTEYLDKNGLDMLWAKVKENTHNQVEVERNRAVAKENSIVDTKADKSALDDYVTDAALKALEQKVTANTTAISAKQDKPDDDNMFLQVKHDSVSGYFKRKGELKFTHDDNDSFYTSISPSGIYCWDENSSINFLRIASSGITLDGGIGTSGYAFTTNGKTARIPTKLSQLANDSNFITANDIDFTPYATIEALTAVEQKVTANTTALEGKQDKGNYIPYTANGDMYEITSPISVATKDRGSVKINTNNIIISRASNPQSAIIERNKLEFGDYDPQMPNYSVSTIYTINGITSKKYNDCLATSDGTFKPISDFVLKTELPTVPTKTSELTNDSNFITADTYDEDGYHLLENLKIGLENNGVLTINPLGIESTGGDGFDLNGTGITFYARGISDIPTAQGSFINIDDYALNSQVTALEQTVTANTTALNDIKTTVAGKQDIIRAGKVDVTNLESANLERLVTIVDNLIDVLASSGLVKPTRDNT